MRHLIIYGIILALLLIMMQFVQYRLLIIRHADTWYTGVVALVCCAAGIWAGLRWHRRQAPLPETNTPDLNVEMGHAAIIKLGITPRELEVLRHIANGLSNQQIADTMYVSLNTVKTHTSHVFAKLDVQRRTQAIQKAKELGILGT
jgi:two-component system, NarL family, response regulator LiaR